MSKDPRKNRWADTRRIVRVERDGLNYIISLECGHQRIRRVYRGYPVAAMRCTTCSTLPVSPLLR